jgi:hypothetical protein
MTTWPEPPTAAAAPPSVRASRRVRPGQVLHAATAAVAAARPATWQWITRAGTWVPEAVVAVFVAVGWVLGFLCWYCPKGLILGFCVGGKILPRARREATRRDDAPGDAPK